MWTLWFVSNVLAAPGPSPALVLTAGGELVFNDPFVVARGARVGVGVFATPWLRVGGAAALHPNLGDTGYTLLTRELIQENAVTPSLSAVTGRAQLLAAIVPLRIEAGGVVGNLGFELGAGLLHTVDDLEALDKEGDVDAVATANQWHPATTVGIVGEIRGRVHGIEVRTERCGYVEVIDGTELKMAPIWVGLAWSWRPLGSTSP